MSIFARTLLVGFWQRAWLLPALSLRTCLRLKLESNGWRFRDSPNADSDSWLLVIILVRVYKEGRASGAKRNKKCTVWREKEGRKCHVGVKASTETFTEAEACLDLDQDKGRCTLRASPHPSWASITERKRFKEFSAPQINNKENLLQMRLEKARLHPKGAGGLGCVVLVALTLELGRTQVKGCVYGKSLGPAMCDGTVPAKREVLGRGHCEPLWK